MRFSRQREAILSFLRSRKDHPTAELVYTSVRESFPNISLGTVYRNLNQLAEKGIIAKYRFGGMGTDHFDYNAGLHQHFVCTRCSAVIDLRMENPGFPEIDEKAALGFDGLILGHKLYFCGLCKNCLDQGFGQIPDADS